MSRYVQRHRNTLRLSLRNRLLIGLSSGIVLSALLIIALVNNRSQEGENDNIDTFTLNYHDVIFKKVIATSDGNFVFTDGKKFIKTDSAGNILWKKQIETNFPILIQSFAELSDRGIVAVCQMIASDNHAKIYLIKLDADGAFKWSKMLYKANSEFAYSIAAGADNDFYLCGSGCSTSNFILKMNAAGDQVWVKDLKAGITVGSAQRIAYRDNELVVTGRLESNGNSELYILKTDLNGNPLQARRVSMSKSFVTKVLKFTPDGGYVIAGNYLTAEGIDNPFILRADINMNPIWMKSYGAEGIETINDIAVTGNTELYVVGNIYINADQNINMLLFKTDALGTIQWQMHAGNEQLLGAGYDDALSVAATNDNHYMITGFSNGGFITKIDGVGNGFCFQRLLTLEVADVPLAMLNVSFQQNILGLFEESIINPQAGSLTLNAPDICYGNASNNNNNNNQNNGNNSYVNSINATGKIEVNLYPNPSNGNLNIELTNELSDPGLINIYDLSGKLLFSQEVQPFARFQKLENTALSNGTYLFQIYSRNEIIASKKIVIQR